MTIKANTTHSKAKKRESIDIKRNKRYVRRDDDERFNEIDDQQGSLSPDRRKKAKVGKPGHGNKRDRHRKLELEMQSLYDSLYS